MDYSFNSRVRYSETGEDGRLTLPGVLNYFQDCSTFHAESIGLGGNVLKNRDRAWVLSSWQVVVEEYPVLGTESGSGLRHMHLRDLWVCVILSWKQLMGKSLPGQTPTGHI